MITKISAIKVIWGPKRPHNTLIKGTLSRPGMEYWYSLADNRYLSETDFAAYLYGNLKADTR